MTTALMRRSLDTILRQSQLASPHAGLWLARGWPAFVKEEGKQGGGGGKSGHLDKVCQQRPSGLYQHAYRRWQALTADTTRFRTFYGQLEQRLFIGLSSGGALETGVTTSHSYGMPMIPGSTVKGVVRTHAAGLGVPASYLAALFGEADEDAGETPARAERLPGAGSLVWHDAWWVPEGNKQPFVREIVTVHHQDYYAGKGEATEFDSPVPNAQIAVQGSFLFGIEGDPAWADLALTLLKKALAERGVGSKVAAGYGAMQEDEEEADEQRSKTLSPEAQLRKWLEGMPEKKLIETFSKNINKTQEEYSAEQWAMLPRLAQEIHAETLKSWAGVKRKDDKNRFKAYRFLMGLNNVYEQAEIDT